VVLGETVPRPSPCACARVQPGSSVTLIAAIHLGGLTAYNAVLSWVSPDGTEVSEETYAVCRLYNRLHSYRFYSASRL